MSLARILFFTDLHYGANESAQRGVDADRLRTLLVSIEAAYKEKPFHLAVFGGDLIDKGNPPKHKAQVMSYMRKALDSIQHKLCTELGLPAKNLLFVPGNHEEPILRDYLSELKERGFSCGSLTTRGNHYIPTHVDFPQHKIAFTLLAGEALEKTRVVGTGNRAGHKSNPHALKFKLNPKQFHTVQEARLESQRLNHLCVAVCHYAPLPIAENANVGNEIIEKRILANSGQVIDALLQNKYAMLLHGDVHMSRVVRHVLFQADRATKPDCQPLVVVSGASCGSNRADVKERWSFYLIGFESAHVALGEAITVRRFTPKEESSSVATAQECVTPHESPRHQYQEIVYKEESFTVVELWRRFGHRDSRPEEVNDFFKTYDALYTKAPRVVQVTKEGVSINDGYEEKLAFLKHLLAKIRTGNRKMGRIFTATPVQIELTYSLGSVLFGIEEARRAAKEEFDAPVNRESQLEPPPGQDERLAEGDHDTGGNVFRDFISHLKARKRGVKQLWNHLDWANVIIGEAVRRHAGSADATNALRIVEAGFGELLTMIQIGHSIPRGAAVEYFGVDIGDNLTNRAVGLLDRVERTSDALIHLRRVSQFKSFPHFNKFNCGDAYDQLVTQDVLGAHEGTVDCFVASYSLHHVFSPRRIARALWHGLTHKILFGPSEDEADTDGLCRSILEGKIFGHVIRADRREVVADHVKNLKFGWPLDLSSNAFELFHDAFEDYQKSLLTKVYTLLQPGGLVCIADPNGFSSSFNRQMVFTDPLIAVSYFNDFNELGGLLEKIGFQIQEVYRQGRLADNSIANVRLDLAYLADPAVQDPSERRRRMSSIIEHERHARNAARNCPKEKAKYEELCAHNDKYLNEDVMHLDFADQHLGYVIVANKPPASEKATCYFNR